ncbi:Crp/Fnr family transcriptional regulator [Herbivorax sp. ANBcel31]|uniref:Crp/Fnr family transcriptional regulator n=1 Tax=Herbivorax sp. ANBcel31 TaxID=3069754 RepID=UPI0027B25C35|nr:Crp/Fnr family transcriptional regulator [Herbivorax sp. ANBcel31]MDQ2085586.1 Crp/Fnr family transcriptional regulator [Herbivorax sp. ANBcel31]
MINYSVLKKNNLFKDIEVESLEKILSCLSAKVSFYKRDEFIYMAGENVYFIGIIMKGKVVILKEDENGNRNILSEVSLGEMFGEALACAEIEKTSVSVQGVEDSEVLLIDYKKIIKTCSSACVFHTKLIENMLKILAMKTIMLNQKIEIVSKRTIREKLITFLAAQKDIDNSNVFTIPYNREQLSDYLYVDRSAMSRELGKMRDEGLINFNKSRFEIIHL